MPKDQNRYQTCPPIWLLILNPSGKLISYLLPVQCRSTSGPFPVHIRSTFDVRGISVKRTPINDVIKPESEMISSRSAVLQPPRLSVLQTLNKQNNNNSNTNNNTILSLRVPQITLNGPKTVSFLDNYELFSWKWTANMKLTGLEGNLDSSLSLRTLQFIYWNFFQKSSTRIPSNDSAICEDIPEDRETSPNRSNHLISRPGHPELRTNHSNVETNCTKHRTEGDMANANNSEQKTNEIKRSDSEPIQSRRKDSGVSSSDEDKIIFVRRARRRKSVLKWNKFKLFIFILFLQIILVPIYVGDKYSTMLSTSMTICQRNISISRFVTNMMLTKSR